MSFYRSKSFWVVTAILSLLLLVTSYYGFKTMTSVYKTDFGNGVFIYADDYVRTGKWVFDCEYSRLISRKPLSVPISELEQSGRLTIRDTYLLKGFDNAQATAAIKAITAINGWHERLRYLYSGLNNSSNLDTHVFDLLASHNGQAWALRVRQWIEGPGRSSFEITAVPYDPETYMDYTKMLQAAAKSCPAPQ